MGNEFISSSSMEAWLLRDLFLWIILDKKLISQFREPVTWLYVSQRLKSNRQLHHELSTHKFNTSFNQWASTSSLTPIHLKSTTKWTAIHCGRMSFKWANPAFGGRCHLFPFTKSGWIHHIFLCWKIGIERMKGPKFTSPVRVVFKGQQRQLTYEFFSHLASVRTWLSSSMCVSFSDFLAFLYVY